MAGTEKGGTGRSRVRATAKPGKPTPLVSKGKPGRPPRDPEDLVPHADGMTARQRRILEYIKEAIEKRGYPPSMREIGEAVGLTSSSSVAHQLASWRRRASSSRDPNRPRALEVFLPEVMAARRGRSVAGRRSRRTTRPGSATPARRDLRAGGRPDRRRRPDPGRGGASRTSSRCPSSWSARARSSCSRSVGDSMVDAAICDGDYVVVRQRADRRQRRHRRRADRRRGDGQDVPAQGRPRLAAAAQPVVRPHRRHPRHDPGQGHGGAAPSLTPPGRLSSIKE